MPSAENTMKLTEVNKTTKTNPAALEPEISYPTGE